MGDPIRKLLILFCLSVLLLNGCDFGGILVVPTPPAEDPSLAGTEGPLPTETEEAPIEHTAAPTETTSPTVSAPTVPQRHDPARPEDYTVSAMERTLLDEIHAMRSRKALPGLTEDSLLGGLACLRASEITREFSHVRPDGREYTSALTDHGCPFSASGEVILRCDEGYSAAYMLEDWLFSPITSAVLTDPKFTHVGVGIWSQSGLWYIVCILTAK